MVKLYLLDIRGELLGLVLGQRLGLVPAGHLGDGLLEELSQLQLSCQAFLLLLLLKGGRGGGN